LSVRSGRMPFFSACCCRVSVGRAVTRTRSCPVLAPRFRSRNIDCCRWNNNNLSIRDRCRSLFVAVDIGLVAGFASVHVFECHGRVHALQERRGGWRDRLRQWPSNVPCAILSRDQSSEDGMAILGSSMLIMRRGSSVARPVIPCR